MYLKWFSNLIMSTFILMFFMGLVFAYVAVEDFEKPYVAQMEREFKQSTDGAEYAGGFNGN